MQKKKIKIFFTDFWNGFNPDNNFFINRLRNDFEIDLDEKNPDYLFYSWNGFQYRKYKNAVKIYFTGENDIPDFNMCDYAISFHPLQFSDRHLRFPLFGIYDCFHRIDTKKFTENELKALSQRKFCSFVVSNSRAADPIRDKFYTELSKYKKIDSGGRYLNNTGYYVPDKYEFIRNYKFNLAFENSQAPGYTSEKLAEPLAENTLPVYWGNPDVGQDFNKNAFINISDFSSIEKAIEEIIRLDNDDDAYLKMITAPAFTEGQKTQKEWLETYDRFISDILLQPKNKAKRLTEFGFARFYRSRNYIFGKIGSLPVIKFIIRKLSYKE